MDNFKAKARTLAEGLEPELAVAVDVMYPIARLTDAVRAFHKVFSTTPLRLYVEALGAVIQPVLDGRCRIGVIGSFPDVPSQIVSAILTLFFVQLPQISHSEIISEFVTNARISNFVDFVR